jgi:preprotein translocase subunit SecD
MKKSIAALALSLAVAAGTAALSEPRQLALRLVEARAEPGKPAPDAADERMLDGSGIAYWVRREDVIDGSMVLRAQAQTSRFTGGPEVQVELTAEGARRLADFSGEHVGRQLDVVVDGSLVAAPLIQSAVTDGKFAIASDMNAEQAAALAQRIAP